MGDSTDEERKFRDGKERVELGTKGTSGGQIMESQKAGGSDQIEMELRIRRKISRELEKTEEELRIQETGRMQREVDMPKSGSFKAMKVLLENREPVDLSLYLHGTAKHYICPADYVEQCLATMDYTDAYTANIALAICANVGYEMDKFFDTSGALSTTSIVVARVIDRFEGRILPENFLDSYVSSENVNALENIFNGIAALAGNNPLSLVADALEYAANFKLLPELNERLSIGIDEDKQEIANIAEVIYQVLTTAAVVQGQTVQPEQTKEFCIEAATAVIASGNIFDTDGILESFNDIFQEFTEIKATGLIGGVYDVVGSLKDIFDSGPTVDKLFSNSLEALNSLNTSNISAKDAEFHLCEIFGLERANLDLDPAVYDAFYEIDESVVRKILNSNIDKNSLPDNNTIYFSSDSSVLSDEAQLRLGDWAEYSMDTVDGITLEGHTDERGTIEYNLALGERRANAAKDYLTESGVNESHITTVSYGEEKPMAFGSGEVAWAQNRRVEIGVESTAEDLDANEWGDGIPVGVFEARFAMPEGEIARHRDMVFSDDVMPIGHPSNAADVHVDAMAMEPLLHKVKPLYVNAYQTYLQYSLPEDRADELDITSDDSIMSELSLDVS